MRPKSWLYLIGWESGASFFKPITEHSKAKPKHFSYNFRQSIENRSNSRLAWDQAPREIAESGLGRERRRSHHGSLVPDLHYSLDVSSYRSSIAQCPSLWSTPNILVSPGKDESRRSEKQSSPRTLSAVQSGGEYDGSWETLRKERNTSPVKAANKIHKKRLFSGKLCNSAGYFYESVLNNRSYGCQSPTWHPALIAFP